MVSKDEIKRKLENIVLSAKFSLLAIIVANLLLFYLYWITTEGQSIYNQLWDYFKSPTFQIVTISLLLPFLSLFVSNIFKVRERLDAQIQKRVDEKKQEQLKCIELTQKMWRELSRLSSEIRYYDGKRPIEEIRSELDQFAITGQEVVNMWAIQFHRSLRDQDSREILLFPSNVLLNASKSVAQFIHDNPIVDPYKKNERSYCKKMREEIETCRSKNDKKEQYQFALGVIEADINYTCHHPVLYIFKNYMILDHENDDNKKKRALKNLEENFNDLKDLAQKLRKIEIKNEDIFSFLKDDENDEIHECSLEDINDMESLCNSIKHDIEYVKEKTDESTYEDYKNEYQEKITSSKQEYFTKIRNSIHYEEFLDLYKEKIRDSKRKYSTKIPYSLNCMNELAVCLDLRMLHYILENQVKWNNKAYSRKVLEYEFK
jgi:hypothetical protein